MAVSIRDVCQGCLGETGTLSLRRDLYGYIWDGGRTDGRVLSVLDHIRLIRGRSINLCCFLVGHEPGFSGTYTEAQAVHIQRSIDVSREIYAQADLGIRRIFWRYIEEDDAGPWLSVNGGQATDLTEAYSGPNDGIDIFWVQTITDAGGWSNSNGPCDKDDKGRTGVVIRSSTGNGDFTGVLLAHEIGHYLTLAGGTSPAGNLMGASSNGGVDVVMTNARDLTPGQIDQIHESCWVRGPC